MRKQSFIAFAALLIFWIVISAAVNFQHILVGTVISLFTVWFWHDLSPRLPGLLSFKELLVFGRCLLMLAGYIVQSNIDVARILLFSNKTVSPIFLELEPGIKSDWGRVFLATCITITPGTITIDFDPETNIFTVHALTREIGVALFYWRMISEIKHLETLVRRRRPHVLDTDRIHDPNTDGVIKSDHRTNRN